MTVMQAPGARWMPSVLVVLLCAAFTAAAPVMRAFAQESAPPRTSTVLLAAWDHLDAGAVLRLESGPSRQHSGLWADLPAGTSNRNAPAGHRTPRLLSTQTPAAVSVTDVPPVRAPPAEDTT
jgi:hypothetical protein